MTAPKTNSVHSVSPSGEAVRSALPALDHPDYWRLMYEHRDDEAHELSEQIIALRASHDALLEAVEATNNQAPVAYQRLVDGKWIECSYFVACGWGEMSPNCRALYARPIAAAPLSSADLALAESFAGPKFPMKEGGAS